jgi:hypothetical protein
MLHKLNEIQVAGVIFVAVAAISAWFSGLIWTGYTYNPAVGLLYILGTGLLLLGLGKAKEVITDG